MGPETHPGAGTNINGPSLIEAPSWIDKPLGRFYLYFAHHKGDHIRLAVADRVMGPFQLHEPGALSLLESGFATEVPRDIEPSSEIQAAAIAAEGYDAHFTPHIASPDVIVDHDAQKVWMAYHGLCDDGSQLTRMAESSDGVDFISHEPLVAFPYLRILPARWHGHWLAMSMPGILYRSDDLRTWEPGPMLFEMSFRHCALLRRDDRLLVFWTRVGDAPEHVLVSMIELSDDWSTWVATPAASVLRPEELWEGADLPIEPSMRGQVTEPVHQLRDPAVFDHDGRLYLLYSVAGESGIALAEVDL